MSDAPFLLGIFLNDLDYYYYYYCNTFSGCSENIFVQPGYKCLRYIDRQKITSITNFTYEYKNQFLTAACLCESR